MEHVDKLLRRLTNATEPFEGIIEGEHAFIKTPNGSWGNKVLANEYIALKLAKLLSITIPDGGICVIDEDTNIDDVMDELDYNDDPKGICFYSKRIEKSSPFVNSGKVIDYISNSYEINRVILFDHLIYNEDRHNGNLLIQNNKKIGGLLMYIIDHSHVFNLKHAWNKRDLENIISNEDYNDDKIIRLNIDAVYYLFFEKGIINEEKLRQEAIRFKEIITKNTIEKLIVDIPDEWNINKEDLEALNAYIMYRLEHIDDMISIIVKYKCGGM